MYILDLIAEHESGGMYDRVYGSGVKTEPLTKMTINEVLSWQDAYVAGGSPSSAAGRYQIIRKTLRGLIKKMKLSGHELFDSNMQNLMAVELLNGRGFISFVSGEITTEKMILNLSKEWASFPKDKGGKSYYAGDGLNKALVSYDEVYSALLKDKDNLNQPTEKENTMTKEAILGVIRHILTFGGGFLANAGYATADEVSALVGAIITIVGLVWSVINKKNA